MSDQIPSSGGRNNPRNNPRVHKKPTRRHAGNVAGSNTATVSSSATGAPAAQGVPAEGSVAVGTAQQHATQQQAGQQASQQAGQQQVLHPQASGSEHASAHIDTSEQAQAANLGVAGNPRERQQAMRVRQGQAHEGQTHEEGQLQGHSQSRQVKQSHQNPQLRQGGYQGYAQGSARVRPATVDAHAGSYGDLSHYKEKRPKRKASLVSKIVAAVILCAIGVGVYLYLNPLQFNVTVNGMQMTVNRGTTLTTLVDEGKVSPKAGNLLAVDGSIIEEGGGTKFTATVNNSDTADANTELHKGDTVQISDGTDTTEDYDVATEEVASGTAESGVGALHVYIEGQPTKIEKRTGKVSGKTVEETIQQGTDSTYFKYDADTNGEKVIALTFDDGPWSTTEEVLDILKENGAVATFFTIGEQISDTTDYTDVIKRMAEEGHQIATHSYDHASSGGGNGVDMTRQSTEDQIAEVQKGQEAIANATGEEASKVFRSPGGNYSGDIIWTLQPYVTAEIGWDIDTMDWSRPGVDSIVQSILSADSGDVILMHDGGGDRSQTVEALKIALPQLVEQGYKFVTIDQLLAMNDASELLQQSEGTQASS